MKVLAHQQEKASKNVNKHKKLPIDASRRKLLTGFAATGTAAVMLSLSGKWSKPVVDSIVLPAHAQATNTTVSTFTTPAPTTTSFQAGFQSTGYSTSGSSMTMQNITPQVQAVPEED